MLDRRCLFLLILFSANIAQAAQPAPKPQELFATYWTSEPGWDTELQMKNNLSSGSLTVTPVLRLFSAQEIPLDPVTIAANDSVSVWVGMGLLKHSPDLLNQPGSYGSVVFRFSSLDARNVFASSVARLRGGPIEFYNEANPVVDFAAWPRAAGPGSQEGIWSQSRSSGNDFLIVSNSSGKLLAAKLWLSDAGGKRWSRSINLAAYQTQRLDFHDLLRSSSLSGTYGGIKVEVPAHAGALHSLHLLYDEAGQTSQLFKMVARDPAATLAERIPQSDHRPWTTWAPMLPLQTPDPGLPMPAGTVLNPTVLVRNTTPKAATATVSITWHGEKEAVDGVAKLQDLLLAPYETRQILIAPLQKQLGIPDTAQWATFKLSSPGLPDDVMAVASSYDLSGRYGIGVAFSDNIGGHFAGGEWRADALHSAIIAVTNAGSSSTQARVTLHYDKGEKRYEVQRTLKPAEQMWLRPANLIQNQVPDRNGSTLPAGLSAGTYEVQDIGGKPGGLLVSSLSTDSTFGSQIVPLIPECCGINVPARFSPNFFDIPPIDIWNPFKTVANDACTGSEDDIGEDMASFWTTNPSIAQMTASGVKGLAVGSTTGEGESEFIWVGAGSNCVLKQVTATAPITVQVPTASVVLNQIDSHANTSCPTNQAGWYRQVLKAVVDQNGNPIELVGQNLDETIKITLPNQLNLKNPQTGTAVTDPNGQFTDTFFDCSALCPGQTDASQTISDILPNGSGPYNLSPNTLVYTCSSITVNGK